MTSLDRLRLEKAGADSGFEMTPVQHLNGLELRSARFPETVLVCVSGETSFDVEVSDQALLHQSAGRGSLKVDGYSELYALLRTIAAHARTKPNRVADEFKKKTATMPNTTEAERLAVQRVGQGLFRGALLDYWQGKCCVTGLDVPELLRASHIKPWAACQSDEERLDVFNGLLLAPQLDALFDGGWISFTEAGEILVAKSLHAEARTILGVALGCCITGLADAHLKYLAYHREREFRSA